MNNRFELDLSSRTEGNLAPDFFFEYPYLTKLNLHGSCLSCLPLSISFCQFLEKIDISGSSISQIPIILATLPKIRENPSNLIYGSGQRCTNEKLCMVLEEASLINQVIFEFLDIDQSMRSISASPTTSLRDITILLHPELANLTQYVTLVRKVNHHVQFLSPDDLPIGAFMYPGSVWSLELKFFPPKITPPIFLLIKSFASNHTELLSSEESIKVRNSILAAPASDESISQIQHQVASCRFFSARHFQVILEGGNAVDIAISPSCACVIENGLILTAIRPFSLSFTVRDGNFLLTSDGRALKLDKEKLSEISEIYSLCIKPWAAAKRRNDTAYKAFLCSEEAVKKLSLN